MFLVDVLVGFPDPGIRPHEYQNCGKDGDKDDDNKENAFYSSQNAVFGFDHRMIPVRNPDNEILKPGQP
jgi:hypothetical protein